MKLTTESIEKSIQALILSLREHDIEPKYVKIPKGIGKKLDIDKIEKVHGIKVIFT